MIRMSRVPLVLLLAAASCAPGAATPSRAPDPTPTARPSVTPRPSPVLPEGFAAHAGARVDVYAALAIPKEDIQRVLSVADAVTPQIEVLYEITFSHRPTLYLFSDEEQLRLALISIWQRPADVAADQAKASGFTLPNVSVAINWSRYKDRNQLTVVPHELTHLVISEYGPSFGRVPVWLHEGLARLSELMLEDTGWQAAEIKYTTVSMAATKTLHPLSGLLSSAFRSVRGSVEVDAAYSQSAQAAEFVRKDVGPGGVPKLIRAAVQGASFRVAYLTVTDRLRYDFEETFPQRAVELAPVPGIAMAVDAPRGPGPFAIVYGFPATAPISVTMTSPGGTWTSSGATTAFGTYRPGLGSLPSGMYTMSATSGPTGASTTVRVSR
jgi:hypothetical protein